MDGDIAPERSPNPGEWRRKPRAWRMEAEGGGRNGPHRLRQVAPGHRPWPPISPVEVINADSMQVYRGLDGRSHQQSPPSISSRFFSSDFLLVGLVSDYRRSGAFPEFGGCAGVPHHLLSCSCNRHDDCEVDFNRDRNALTFDRLKDIDPVAAQRIHPNDLREINQYLNLYAQSGLLPSELFQSRILEGRTGGVLRI